MNKLRRAALAAFLLLPGCGGIDLGSPGPVSRATSGPLTVPPHMRDGAHQ